METAFANGLWIIVGVALLGTAVRSRRNWGEPGSRPFTALTAVLGLVSLALGARAVDPRAHLVAIPLLYNAVPVLWAVFAFEFTGRYDVSSRQRRLLLAAPAVFQSVVFVGFTLAASDLTGTPIVATNIDTWYAVVTSATGPGQTILLALYTWLFLGLFVMLGLLLVATVVLVAQLVRYEHLGTRVALLLSVSVVGPLLVMMTADSVSSVANLDAGTVQLSVATSFAVAAAGMAMVLERYDLFAVAPAAGTFGPERVLEDLSEPIVVVDHDERVTRLNPAARRVFGTDGQYVGAPITALLGHDVSSLEDAVSLDIDGVDGHHHYEAKVSEITGRGGQVRGHTVVLRDVTERQVRQQRLEVLNRVLRHNLRNDLTAIRGRAELLGTGDVDEAAVRDVIVDRADELVTLSDRAREVEQMLSVPVAAGHTCDLGTVVSTVVDGVADEYEVTVATDVPEEITVGVDARILHPVVNNLVVNAIGHHDRDDPTIEVAATVGDGSLPVELSVVDDGPGLPEQERIAVERGRESPLEHGSGLGLWAIKWGVTRIGGHLSIRDNEPRGTVVEISLPAAGATAAANEYRVADVGRSESVSGDTVSSDSGSPGAPGPRPTGDASGTGQ